MRNNFKVMMFLIGMIVIAAAVSAQIPERINYQGFLVDSGTGEGLAGPVVLTFSLF